MKVDSANRAFVTLLGVSWLLGGYAICGAVAGVLVPVVVAHVARDGWGALGNPSLLPTFAVFGLVTVGAVRASRAFRSQLVASRRVARHTRALAVEQPSRLVEAARASGLAGRLAVVADPEPFSLVHGALRPRVVISRALLERLSDAQLRAVLEHERYHVINLDPLKSVAIQVLRAGLFFLPALAPLQARYAAARELAADRHAISVCGRRSLAGALLQAVRGPDWCGPDIAVALGSETLLGGRLTQLETGAAPRPSARRVARAMLGLAGSTTLLTVAFVAAARAGGPEGLPHTGPVATVAGALLNGILCATPFAGISVCFYLGLTIRRRIADKPRDAIPPLTSPADFS